MSAISQQSEMADRVYQRLAQAPVSAAELVQELHAKWGPEHGVGEVHGFVEEVACCLLHHEDVDVGDMHDGQFVSWGLEPWYARDRIERELLAMNTFLDDTQRFVFQRKAKA
jgi:hypothetical protein